MDGGLGQSPEVAAQHPGDSPTGPDQGGAQLLRPQHMEEPGKEPAKQVKGQKAPVAQVILQGLSKEPEKPHIAEEVDLAPMEEQGAEHGGQQSQPLV